MHRGDDARVVVEEGGRRRAVFTFPLLVAQLGRAVDEQVEGEREQREPCTFGHTVSTIAPMNRVGWASSCASCCTTTARAAAAAASPSPSSFTTRAACTAANRTSHSSTPTLAAREIASSKDCFAASSRT